MTQLGLAFFGLAALWMATSGNALAQRWACVVGICGQPFWLAFAAQKDSWALGLIAAAYTFVYAHRIGAHFLMPRLRAHYTWFDE